MARHAPGDFDAPHGYRSGPSPSNDLRALCDRVLSEDSGHREPVLRLARACKTLLDAAEKSVELMADRQRFVMQGPRAMMAVENTLKDAIRALAERGK